MLNIFNFLDYKLWPKTENSKLVKEFLDFVSEIIDPEKEQNLMFTCYNPLMAICLFCENLKRVGDAIALFKHSCTGISSNLQELGEKIIENMDESIVESVFIETDFMDRTVLKLISDNEYEPLMRD
jgi:hypothetical protein